MPTCRGRAPTAPGTARVPITLRPVAAAGALVLWSLTYLARQATPPGATVGSPLGDFALEGAVLALAWLAAVLTACLGSLLAVPQAPATAAVHGRPRPERQGTGRLPAIDLR